MNRNPPSSSNFAAFIGLDWANAKHDICLQVPGRDVLEHLVIETSARIHRPVGA